MQVSRFLAKLLLRVNATRSEREKRRALENVLLQQVSERRGLLCIHSTRLQPALKQDNKLRYHSRL